MVIDEAHFSSHIRQLADMGRKIDEANVHNALLTDLRYVFKQLHWLLS